MKLNADLGESFGQYKIGNDEAVMPLIDQANIACTYHAGDPLVMKNAIRLAKLHDVSIGAHPSYPDLQGFGRRSMNLASDELVVMVQAQIAMLEGLAKCQGVTLSYVKPHGALYNDMMRAPDVLANVMQALSDYHTRYPLMLQATSKQQEISSLASTLDIPIIFEAFADRAYCDDGTLRPRDYHDAVLSESESLKQVEQLLTQKVVTSVNGKQISINADTICVHSDNERALELCKKIRELIDKRVEG